MRALLEWHRNGKLWIYITDEDEALIEPILLEALKHVVDPEMHK